jgi:hypothetical protein
MYAVAEVPIADIAVSYSIISSARLRKVSGIASLLSRPFGRMTLSAIG